VTLIFVVPVDNSISSPTPRGRGIELSTGFLNSILLLGISPNGRCALTLLVSFGTRQIDMRENICERAVLNPLLISFYVFKEIQ